MARSLRSKVSPFFPHKDKDGEFIAYCDFKIHRGIVMRPRVCERRKCRNYLKMYINQENKLYNTINKFK